MATRDDLNSYHRNRAACIDIQTDSPGKEAESMLIAEDTIAVLTSADSPGSEESLTH